MTCRHLPRLPVGRPAGRASALAGATLVALLPVLLGALVPAPGAGAAPVLRAGACTSAALTAGRQALTRTIGSQVAELQALQEATVRASLPASDSAALASDLAASRAASESLAPQVPAATDCGALARLAAMARSLRVFSFVAPRTHLVIAADVAESIAVALAPLPAKLAPLVAASPAGATSASARAALADLGAMVVSARSSVATAAASLLALQASGYPGNVPALRVARTDVTNARNDLHAAVGDIGALRRLLR